MKPLLYNSKFEHLNMIKFSIIIPVFNGENFINQCIESIIDENYFNYEIIVINDGSFEILKKYLTTTFTYEYNQESFY